MEQVLSSAPPTSAPSSSSESARISTSPDPTRHSHAVLQRPGWGSGATVQGFQAAVCTTDSVVRNVARAACSEVRIEGSEGLALGFEVPVMIMNSNSPGSPARTMLSPAPCTAPHQCDAFQIFTGNPKPEIRNPRPEIPKPKARFLSRRNLVNPNPSLSLPI
eukprot:1162977-Rhodomonas_salina.1